MKQSTFAVAILAELCMACLFVKPVYANDTAPISIKASLVSPPQISLGEPILVQYKFTNRTHDNVSVSIDPFDTSWYTFSMSDTTGNAVSEIPGRRPVEPGGAHGGTGFQGAYGSEVSGYIVVSKFMAIEQPGNYTLTVHIKMGYVINSQIPKHSILAARGDEATDRGAYQRGIVQENCVFPVVITKADAPRLSAVAMTLKQSAIGEQDLSLAQAEVSALFAMPESQASPAWRSLAVQSHLQNLPITDELKGLHSTTGVDILFQMYDAPSAKWTPASLRLYTLCGNATPDLQAYIRMLAVQRGMNWNSIISGPLRVD